MIESLLVLPLLVGVFCALLTLCYHSGLYVITSYQCEEALLCVAAAPNKASTCERTLKQRLKRILLFNEDLQVHFATSSFQITADIRISHIHFEKRLRLPLEKNL